MWHVPASSRGVSVSSAPRRPTRQDIAGKDSPNRHSKVSHPHSPGNRAVLTIEKGKIITLYSFCFGAARMKSQDNRSSHLRCLIDNIVITKKN